MKKILIPFFAGLFLVIVFFYAARGWVSKIFFETFITALTGFDTNVRSVTVNLGKGVFELKNPTILNPDGFEKRVFADIPEILLEFDLFSMLEAKKIHIYLLKLNIRELNIETRGDGRSNLVLLKTSERKDPFPGSEVSPDQSASSSGGTGKESSFYIRKFMLTMGKVNYQDKSNLVPISLSTDAKLENAVFFGIDQPDKVLDLIVLSLLAQTKFGNLGLDPAEIGRAVKETAQTTIASGDDAAEEEELKDVVENVRDEISAFWDEVKAKFRKKAGDISE